MSNSDHYGEESRLQKLMRETSGQLKERTSARNNLSQSGHPSAQLYNQSEVFMNNDYRNNSDVRSLVQNLMKTKDMRMSPDIGYLNSKPILVRAEQKIFQQVINLLAEINEIKENINKEKEMTLQLEAERDNLLSKSNSRNKGGKKIGDIQMDSIINKLRSRQGDDYRISMTQLQKIAAENQHLEMNINRMKIQRNGNVKQVLQQERRRFQSLKAQLQEKKAELDYENLSDQDSQDIMVEVKKVQADIQRLRGQGRNEPDIEYEIRVLNQENQKLRDKTVRILQQTPQSDNMEDQSERRRLQEYLQQEEQNKILFMEDLKKFKAEYNQLLEENARLKRQAGDRANIVMNDGNSSRNNNRLYQYKDLVSEMQSVMK